MNTANSVCGKSSEKEKINTTSDDDDSNKQNHVNSTVEALETSREWLENARTILLKRTTCKKKSNGNASSAKTTVNEHWRQGVGEVGDRVPVKPPQTGKPCYLEIGDLSTAVAIHVVTRILLPRRMAVVNSGRFDESSFERGC